MKNTFRKTTNLILSFILLIACSLTFTASSKFVNTNNQTENIKVETVLGNNDTFDAKNTNTLMSGIDISGWQESVDWAKVKASGVQFVMLRICTYSSANHAYDIDPMLDSHIKGAKAQGIHIGGYFFSYAKSLAEIPGEANFVLSLINRYPSTFDFPIVFDAESTNIQSFAADACVSFCSILEQNNYWAMIYASTNWFNTIIVPSSKISGYALWQAHYPWATGTQVERYTGYTPSQSTSIASARPAINNNNNNVTMWQFTQKGTVSGIGSECVDMNVCYTDYSKVIPAMGKNGFPPAHTCSYNTLKYDGNNHWYECSCGAKSGVTAHNYSSLKNDANNHWNECVCGAKSSVVAHNYSTVRSDSEGHWHECTCGLKTEKTPHQMAPSYNDSNHFTKCSVCNYNTGDSVPHVHDKQSLNETHHYFMCDCGHIDQTTYQEHSYTVSSQGDYHELACDCGYNSGPIEHQFTQKRSNSSGHWYKCSCGATTEVIEHNYYNTFCTDCGFHRHDGEFEYNTTSHSCLCTGCNEEITENHTLNNNGVCRCGYTSPIATPGQDENINDNQSNCAMAISISELPIQFTAFTLIATLFFITIKKRKNINN